MTGQLIGTLILWLIVAVIVIAIIVYLVNWLIAAHRRRCRSSAPASSAKRW